MWTYSLTINITPPLLTNTNSYFGKLTSHLLHFSNQVPINVVLINCDIDLR